MNNSVYLICGVCFVDSKCVRATWYVGLGSKKQIKLLVLCMFKCTMHRNRTSRVQALYHVSLQDFSVALSAYVLYVDLHFNRKNHDTRTKSSGPRQNPGHRF